MSIMYMYTQFYIMDIICEVIIYTFILQYLYSFTALQKKILKVTNKSFMNEKYGIDLVSIHNFYKTGQFLYFIANNFFCIQNSYLFHRIFVSKHTNNSVFIQ